MHLLPWGNNFLGAEANPTPLENPNTHWEVPYNRLSAKKLVDLPVQWHHGESAPLPCHTHPWHIHTCYLPMPSWAGREASSSILSCCLLLVIWLKSWLAQPIPLNHHSHSPSCHVNFEAKLAAVGHLPATPKDILLHLGRPLGTVISPACPATASSRLGHFMPVVPSQCPSWMHSSLLFIGLSMQSPSLPSLQWYQLSDCIQMLRQL